MTTISAKIIADSVSSEGSRLTTMQLRYPRCIHSEFMTHRVFSRNASSSRAVPVERLIQDVLDDPFVPLHWGKNQRGMQADEECDELVEVRRFEYSQNEMTLGYDEVIERVGRETAWMEARDRAVEMARNFSEARYHKQVVNRLLEPFSHINVLVTATEWNNFFELRDHPDAEPHFQLLAKEMRKARDESTPVELIPGEWHLPYVSVADRIHADDAGDSNLLVKLSVARCARVSYLTQDGLQPLIENDLALYDRLVGSRPLHASPAEHQATPDSIIPGYEGPYGEWRAGGWERPSLWGNLRGWKQYRKMLEEREWRS